MFKTKYVFRYLSVNTLKPNKKAANSKSLFLSNTTVAVVQTINDALWVLENVQRLIRPLAKRKVHFCGGLLIQAYVLNKSIFSYLRNILTFFSRRISVWKHSKCLKVLTNILKEKFTHHNLWRRRRRLLFWWSWTV